MAITGRDITVVGLVLMLGLTVLFYLNHLDDNTELKIKNDKVTMLLEIKQLFSASEIESVKAIVCDFCHPDNPLKPTNYNAVNQSFFVLYGVDDDTFIDRLVSAGVLESKAGKLSAMTLSDFDFQSLTDSLKKL